MSDKGSLASAWGAPPAPRADRPPRAASAGHDRPADPDMQLNVRVGSAHRFAFDDLARDTGINRRRLMQRAINLLLAEYDRETPPFT